MNEWGLRTPEALLSTNAEKVTVDPLPIAKNHNAEGKAGGGEAGYQGSPNLFGKKHKYVPAHNQKVNLGNYFYRTQVQSYSTHVSHSLTY